MAITTDPAETKKILVPPNVQRELHHHQVDQQRMMAQMIADNMGEAEPLLKAVSGTEKFARRVSPFLAMMGAYHGIVEPSKASQITLDLLRQMGRSTAILRAIIDTRVLQVKRFCRPGTDHNRPGFAVELRDAAARPTHKDKQRMAELVDLVARGGVRRRRPWDRAWGVWSGDFLEKAMPFPQAMGALTRDSLILDGGAVWLNQGLDSERWPVTFFKPIDTGLIRAVLPAREHFDLRFETQAPLEDFRNPLNPNLHPEWVLLRPDQSATAASEEERVCAAYGPNDLAYLIRNQQTDWWAQYYGYSELETMLEVVLSIINGIAYNRSWFTNNSVPPGILYGTGNFGEEWLSEFVTTLVMQVSGAQRWHKMPMLFGDDPAAKLEYLQLRDTKGQDMMWREWLIFLINLACACYHIAAEEVNFQAFLTRGGGLGDSGGAERVAMAQETGLRTLIQDQEDFVDEATVSKFYPDPENGVGPYRLVFHGLDDEDEEHTHQYALEDVQGGLKTINEIRAIRDEPPVRDPVNTELWDQVRERALALRPELATDPLRLDEVTDKVYRKHHGSYHRWPDMPIGAGALQARSQELQEQQGGAGGGMGPDGQPLAPGQPGAEEEPPDGGHGFSPQMADLLRYQRHGAGRDGELEPAEKSMAAAIGRLGTGDAFSRMVRSAAGIAEED